MSGEMLKEVNARREEIRRLAERNHVWIGYNEEFLKSIKKVLIIASASRSGSSLMFDLIKRYPNIISTRGETVPFYKLTSLASDDKFSDAILEQEITQDNGRRLIKELSEDLHLYRRINKFTDEMMESYAYQLALRFIIQWPMIPFNCAELLDIIKAVLQSNRAVRDQFDKNVVFLDIIKNINPKHPEINPYYYDIPKELIEELMPEFERPSGPPNLSLLIEEPPFIVIDPTIPMNGNDVKNPFLLMKEPVVSYRMEVLKKLFCHAEFYWIHLTRNPAGCINGLMDGWLDRGFFSSKVSDSDNRPFQQLEIEGYANGEEWSKYWWNFDRPPGWQKLVKQPLARVCAFQWLVNNQAIIQGLEEEKNKISVKYEEILSLKKREMTFAKIEDFIGCKTQLSAILDIYSLPVIQSTKDPKMYRWKERESEILPVLDAPEFIKLTEKLGYKKDNMVEWL